MNCWRQLKNLAKETLKTLLPAEIWHRLKCWVWRNDLPALAALFGTDKQGVHCYCRHYQQHLGHLRRKSFNLLEIGVGGHESPHQGCGSLRMWKAFFPHAQINGIDIFDKSALEEPRIRIFRGSQADPEFLRKLVDDIGPLEVIIDDGSHVNEHVLTSFHILFPLLADGGVYVIEDLATSYWPEFGGSERSDAMYTSMNFLKSLIDGLNWEEFRDREPGPYDRGITSIHFYHNLAFITKGVNLEGTTKNTPHIVRR